MTYRGITAETTTIKGHAGDEIEAYYARPEGAGTFPGVVVIHHGPGWDAWTGEVVLKLAQHGYATISPTYTTASGRATQTMPRLASVRRVARPTSRCRVTFRVESTGCGHDRSRTAK